MMLWMVTSIALAGKVEIVVGNGGEVNVSASDKPVYVPACRGILWDLFNPETRLFEPAVVPACDGMKPAIRVDEEGHRFQLNASLPPFPKVGFHVVRPVVVYGLKCAENLPFPLSDCAEIKAEKGPQMVVRTRGSVVEISPSVER